MLYNFLTFLEIFLNEERKQQISFGYISMDEIHSMKVLIKNEFQ